MSLRSIMMRSTPRSRSCGEFVISILTSFVRSKNLLPVAGADFLFLSSFCPLFREHFSFAAQRTITFSYSRLRVHFMTICFDQTSYI